MLNYSFAIVICVYSVNSAKIIESFGSKDFKVYWNVPTFQCRSHKIYFEDLLNKFDIIQNENNDFKGQAITILYDPGNFPAILNQDGTDVPFLRNGGVPQEGNLTDHLWNFEDRVQKDIPNESFTGVAVVDFESWRPIYRQNWGTLQPYKTFSVEIERRRHPKWPGARLQSEAAKRFEGAGNDFVKKTLLLAKSLRPNATWGYYAYPYCFNMLSNNMVRDCSAEVQQENDRMSFMFKFTDNLHPSLYLPQKRLDASQRIAMIEGRITESQRINTEYGHKKTILPYFWYLYQDTKEFLSAEDLRNSLIVLKAEEVDGVIIWGSSSDVNSKAKCEKLYEYVGKYLGPLLIST